MKKLQIYVPLNGSLAYEDYYTALKSCLIEVYHISVNVVIYQDCVEILVDTDTNDTIYMFMSSVPSAVLCLCDNKQPSNVYFMNTEQLTRSHWLRIVKEYINKGIKVFDYDLYQSKLDVKINYLPYQLNFDELSKLTKIIKNTDKLYHVAFCSTNQSNKRKAIYNGLQSRGLKVIDVNGWGEMRDREIASAYILINIHYDVNYQIFEHMRCDRWIMSGMLVVSENSLSDELLDCRDLMICDDYQHIIDKVIDVVEHYQEYYIEYISQLMAKRQPIMNQRQQYCNSLLS